MKSIAITAGLLLAFAVTGCSGIPVQLGTPVSATSPSVQGGVERPLTAEACGFQLLLLIPISTNTRLKRAYNSLLLQAGGDAIVDVQMKESWYYAFVGTGYCTKLEAKAVKAPSGGV